MEGQSDVPPVPAYAMSAHGSERKTLVTVPLDDGMEAVVALDHITGDLTGYVLDRFTGKFFIQYRHNVITDFPLRPGRQPQYIMVAGLADFRQFTSNDRLAAGVIYIAEENSGRLVTQVRHRAAQLADELKAGLILGDGPPGTGCPVIASVSGADWVLIVTEPTVSGVHDLERVVQLATHFRVPVLVVINKADLNSGQARRIEALAAAHGARVIGRIPFDRTVNDALMAGQTVIEYGPSAAERALREIWHNVQQTLAIKQNGMKQEPKGQ